MDYTVHLAYMSHLFDFLVHLLLNSHANPCHNLHNIGSYLNHSLLLCCTFHLPYFLLRIYFADNNHIFELGSRKNVRAKQTNGKNLRKIGFNRQNCDSKAREEKRKETHTSVNTKSTCREEQNDNPQSHFESEIDKRRCINVGGNEHKSVQTARQFKKTFIPSMKQFRLNFKFQSALVSLFTQSKKVLHRSCFFPYIEHRLI